MERMPKLRKRTLGQVIRERRRQLNLTQHEVARRIKTSTPYVGHLEADKRHPSILVISRLAEVLGLDRRDLFVLANPGVVSRCIMQGQVGTAHGRLRYSQITRLMVSRMRVSTFRFEPPQLLARPAGLRGTGRGSGRQVGPSRRVSPPGPDSLRCDESWP